MTSVYVLFRYNSNKQSYIFLHEIKLTEIETENILRYGSHIMYIETLDFVDIIELYLEKPIGLNKIEIENIDYDLSSSFEINYDDLIEEINKYAEENINIKFIDHNHINCNFRKICGCGCDELHNGWGDEYCNPYPYNAHRFNSN